MFNLRKIALGALLASAPAAAATADTAALATFLEPSHTITRYQSIEFAENVRKATDGGIDIEVFSGGSLIPALGSLEGISSGVAQMGVHAAAYTPSQLPVNNSLADMGFLVPDPFVLAFGFADFVMNEPIVYDEWRKNGVIFVGSHATPPYQILCRDDLSTLEDLQGVRTRTTGGAYSRFAEATGILPVAIPSSEIFTAMERGALDCAIVDVTHLQTGASIGELVGSVIMVNMAPSFNSGGLLFDVEYWQGLTDDLRRMMLDQSALSMVRLEMAYAAEAEASLDYARESGIALNEPAPELARAYAHFLADDVGGMTEVAARNLGIERPGEVFTLFRTYLDKWDGLFDGVDRSDEEALVALVKAELFDKIDVTAYGME